MNRSRILTISKASFEYFLAGYGVPNILLTSGAAIWDIKPYIILTICFGLGAILAVGGGYDKYQTTKKKMLKAIQDDEKIEMVVKELQDKHVLAHSRDFTTQLSSLVARTDRSARTIRRKHHNPNTQPHSSMPTSPATTSRATTVNISMDPHGQSMQFDVKRRSEGGITVLTYPNPSESPSASGLMHRHTPQPFDTALGPEAKTPIPMTPK
jgi:hypothetical protein